MVVRVCLLHGRLGSLSRTQSRCEFPIQHMFLLMQRSMLTRCPPSRITFLWLIALMSSQPCLAQGDQDAANQRLSTRGSTGRSAANIDQEDASTKISIHFDDQPTGRYRGDRLKKDWPGLQSASSDRSQVVSRTDALRGRDGKCLKVTYPAGKFRSKASGARFKVRLEPREEYSLDYFVRFGHGNGDHWEFRRGGKLPGLAGGKCNTGGHRSTGDGWSVRYMWRDEGRMVAYVYHLDQKKGSRGPMALGVHVSSGTLVPSHSACPR